MGNDMACRREISMFIKDNGVDLFVTEALVSAQGVKAKTVELAPCGFDMKSLSCHLMAVELLQYTNHV